MADHALTAAAQERAWRTFAQGAGFDILLAIAAAVLVWVPDANVSSGEAWSVLGISVLKSVLTAAASYVMRLKSQPATETEV